MVAHMAEMRVNSAVVCEANIPIGIVTDTDMSSKIATGRFPITVAVDNHNLPCNGPGKCFAESNY
jgi:CBS domain-containing protein